MSRDTRKKKKSATQPREGGDMGRGSFEGSQESGKGPSQSKQGPRQVPVKRDG